MKVLLSAYACEPGRGSEPEIGWQWAMHLSQKCDLTVITRENNREVIEKALLQVDTPHPKFVYIDLSRPFRWLKSVMRPRSLGVMAYYTIWQRRARKEISRLLAAEQYDILHHSTFGAFRLPFAVSGHGIPCVVGPVGGCENFPQELFPENCIRICLKERLRNFVNWYCIKLGVGMSRYSNVDAVLGCTREMHEVFSQRGLNSSMMPNIGMLATNGSEPSKKSIVNGGVRLLFVGRLFYWKGLELAVQAMISLPENVTLSIVGDGPDAGDLQRLIKQKNLSDRVMLLGRVERSDVMEMYKNFDVFLFPSLHDSGGFVVLEAMAAGLPVICLGCGGPTLAVDADSGVIVPVSSREQTISDLSKAIETYIKNPDKLIEHGQKAVVRVKEEYDWNNKAEEMMKLYHKLIGDKQPQ